MEDKTYSKSYDWLKPHQFKKGNPGGPGRPKGKSMKVWFREHFAEMTDEERAEFAKYISPLDAWKMAEGNPDNKSSIDAEVTHKLDPETQQMIENALKDM